MWFGLSLLGAQCGEAPPEMQKPQIPAKAGIHYVATHLCNPLRIQVGARRGVPLRRFFHTFGGTGMTPEFLNLPEGKLTRHGTELPRRGEGPLTTPCVQHRSNVTYERSARPRASGWLDRRLIIVPPAIAELRSWIRRLSKADNLLASFPGKASAAGSVNRAGASLSIRSRLTHTV